MTEFVIERGMIVDPPSGWMYGFPKPYAPNEGESFEDWLVREGYPTKDLPVARMATRFWRPEAAVNPTPQIGFGDQPSSTNLGEQ